MVGRPALVQPLEPNLLHRGGRPSEGFGFFLGGGRGSFFRLIRKVSARASGLGGTV